MQINTTENYLSLAIQALDEILLPELQSSAAKSTVDILKTSLLELHKRETVAPKMLVAVIQKGEALLADINAAIGAKEIAAVHVDEKLAYRELIKYHGELSQQLSTACALLAKKPSNETMSLLRAAAEWELSYYAESLQQVSDISNPTPEPNKNNKQSLDKTLLEQYINSIDLGQGKPVSLSQFQALPGGFGKQTYMCAFTQEDGKSRELIVRKMDPKPIMSHGGCKLSNEYALLRALPDHFPAPKPFAYAANWNNIDGDFYLVDRSPGTVPGAFLSGISGEVSEQVILDLARYLGELHSLPIEQFAAYAKNHEVAGVLAGDTQNTYRKNLDGWLEYIANEEHMPSPYLIWLTEWMANNIPTDTRPPVLIHGDFNVHNVLAHEGRVSCILDWECAGFGAAEQDLAYIRGNISQHIEWQKFVDHYLLHGGREPREELMNYGMVYAALRTNLAGNKATFNLQTGRNRDLRYAMVELGFTQSFMNLALQSASN